MTFRDDERGRVPFALIGALLLVSSVTVVHVQPQQPAIDRPTAALTEQAHGTAETTVRESVQAGAAAAAADPVIEPAGTYGDVLNDERAFESYLELLTYVTIQQRLGTIAPRQGSYTATVSLTPVTDPSSARDAIERTQIEPSGNGSVSVTVEDVEITVRNDETIIQQESRTIATTVATPVLTMHEATDDYERTLNAPPTSADSLGRELTGRLYPIGWARGQAQYRGAPIDDVIAHRHVEVATAGGLVDRQRATFGGADPHAERDLARATARTGTDDLLPGDWAGRAQAGLPEPGENVSGDIESPDYRQSEIEVGSTADHAFGELLTRGEQDFEAIIEAAHAVEGRVTTNVRFNTRDVVQSGGSPGAGWHYVGTDERVSIHDVSSGQATIPGSGSRWETVDSAERTVTIERVYTHKWTDGNNTRTTRLRVHDDYGVGIAVNARAGSLPTGPDRPVHDLLAPGNPPAGVDGPDPVSYLQESLINDRGGIDAIAERAVFGDVDTGVQHVDIPVDPAVRAWVYEDLAAIREDVRDIRVDGEPSAMLVGDNPATELEARVNAQRDTLVDVPGRYENRPHRAKIVVRDAYMEIILDELAADSGLIDGLHSAVDSELDRLAGVSRQETDGLLQAGMDHTRPEPRSLSPDSPSGPLNLSVQAEPAHPDTNLVTEPGPRSEGADPYYPLAVRMGTMESIPVGDIAEGAVDRVFQRADTVPAPVGARAYRQLDRIPPGYRTDTMKQQRAELERELETSYQYLKREAIETLAAETDLSPGERELAVQVGLSQYETVADQIVALENGSAVTDIAAEVESIDGADSTQVRDRVETIMGVRIEERLADQAVQIPEGPVESVVDTSNDVAADVAADAAEDGLDKIQEKLDGGISLSVSGVPLAPFPKYWIATGNIWTVEVAGEYASFSVRSPTGSPETGGQVTYIRDGSTVRQDITGDGTEEVLGTASRLTYETWTTVIVVVPRGRTGVGNADQSGITCTDGWPDGCLPLSKGD